MPYRQMSTSSSHLYYPQQDAAVFQSPDGLVYGQHSSYTEGWNNGYDTFPAPVKYGPFGGNIKNEPFVSQPDTGVVPAQWQPQQSIGNTYAGEQRDTSFGPPSEYSDVLSAAPTPLPSGTPMSPPLVPQASHTPSASGMAMNEPSQSPPARSRRRSAPDESPKSRKRPSLVRNETHPGAQKPVVASSSGKKTQKTGRIPHNLVERRYREHLNSQIHALRETLPKDTITGSLGDDGGLGPKSTSKAVVIAMAVNYIQELEAERTHLLSTAQSLEQCVAGLHSQMWRQDSSSMQGMGMTNMRYDSGMTPIRT